MRIWIIEIYFFSDPTTCKLLMMTNVMLQRLKKSECKLPKQWRN
jgi:hypothetical protein